MRGFTDEREGEEALTFRGSVGAVVMLMECGLDGETRFWLMLLVSSLKRVRRECERAVVFGVSVF